MTWAQIAYVAALVVLVVWRGGYAVWCLIANAAAVLAVCLAMDLGLVSRLNATINFMLIDFLTGCLMAVRPGFSRVVSFGFALTIPAYAANIVSMASDDATFAIVWVVLVLQIGVVAIGSSGNRSGGNRSRLYLDPFVVGVPRGDIGKPAANREQGASFLEGMG